MIYTNNQGPREWAQFIKKYFERKIQYNLFNQIIAAFKINGKQVEICRTTQNKTHTDLIKCTQVPENTQICFLDDNYFPEMIHDNVFYIQVKPYVHDLPFEEMVTRFEQSKICKKLFGRISTDKSSTDKSSIDLSSFSSIMMIHFKRYAYDYIEKSDPDYEVDKIITKKIMLHLQAFFRKPKIKTRKNTNHKNNNKNNKTCKKLK